MLQSGMEEWDLELYVETHLLFNIYFLHRISMTTFELDQQFIDVVMARMPQHVENHAIKQCLRTKTHLCRNLLALFEAISPMFLSIGDTTQPIMPKVLVDNASKVRLHYALMMLRMSREFLNRPDGAQLLKLSNREKLLVQESTVETFFKLQIEEESFSNVVSKLWVDLKSKNLDSPGQGSSNINLCKESILESDLKDDKMDEKRACQIRQYLVQVSDRIESFELVLAKAAIFILPRIAASAIVSGNQNQPNDDLLRRVQSSHL